MKHWLFLAWLSCCTLTSAPAQTIHAVTENTPYTFLVDGKVVGSATEVVELTLKRAGLNDYKINLYPWARSYDMALKTPNVLIYLIARTSARENQFHWAGEIMKIQYHLYRLKQTPLAVSDLESAKRFTIGVMRDDVRHQYLKAKGFDRLVLSAQSVDNFRKLLSGQVDLVPLTADDASSLCKETRFDCADLERVMTLDEASTGLYMAYSRATAQEVVDRTRGAFDKLKTEGHVKRIMERRP